MPFNSLLRECFEGINIDKLIQRMFAHIKARVENPRMLGFTLDQIMHLHINFHKLVLRGSSYIELLDWSDRSKK